jgi:outer membrane receptor protein involved in Fe transport
MKKNVVRLLCLLGASCYILSAQNAAGTGGIAGVVKDASGSVVPGAAVIVQNESKGIRREMTSTDSGDFDAASLPPASGYSVRVSKTGFADYEAKNIQLEVGQTIKLTPSLQVATASTQVDVTSQAPIVDATKTDVSQVVGEQQIQDLPINGRRVDRFVLLAPAVVADGTFGLLSFRGIAGGNAFLTDGNDTTEGYYNENAGRTRIQSQISQDAVQEFQVVSNNYSAEFGHAMGGVVNTVTRSGTNDFHGTTYWFFRNQDFNARDPFANINPQELRNQFGASAGGHIIKDKLFYFFNYEGLRRDFPLIANITSAGNPLFSTTGQFIGQCGAAAAAAKKLAKGELPASAAQCTAAQSFLNRQFQTVPRSVTQDLGFGKLDWRPNERNTFSVDMNLLRWVSPNGLQTQAVLNNAQGVGNNVNSSVRDKNGRFSWTAIPTPSMVNEFRFGWFNDKQYDYPNSALAIPGIGFLGIGITGQSNLGTATDYPRENPLENRYEYADTLSWSTGKHSFKFGVDIMRTEDYTNLLFNRTGTYTFPDFNSLALDLTGNTTNSKDWSTFTQTIGNPVVDFTVPDYAFFAQDSYKVTSRLTVNLGLRYDYADLPQPKVTNPTYPATGRIPTYDKDIAPRVGFAYALDGQNKNVLRGGYGIFYARYPGGLINSLFLGNGLYQQGLTFNSSNATDKANGPVFPNVFPSNAVGYSPPAGSVSLNLAANNLRDPYTEQGDLAFEHQLSNSMSMTVSGIWSRGLHLTSVNDVNIGPPGPVVTYHVDDASGNQIGTYSTPVYVRQNRIDPRYSRINVVEGALDSWYNGLAVQLTKRYSHGLVGNIAYTWSHAIDEGQGSAGTPNIFASGGPQSYIPGDYRDEKGTSALDVRQRLVVNGDWAPTFTNSNSKAAKLLLNGWELSVLGTFQTSPPATPSVQITSAPTPAGYSAAFTGSLDGYTGGGLGSRVPFEPISGLNVDSIQTVDARLTKNFIFTERYRAMFTFDAFNVFNHTYYTSISTTQYQLASGTAVPTLIPKAGFGVGTATQGFPDGTNARRLQIGARFVW